MSFTDREYSILVGMILGDGHLKKRSLNTTLQLHHGPKQKEYIIFKKELLEVIYDKKLHLTEISSGDCFVAFVDKRNNKLKELIYPQGIKTYTVDNLKKLTTTGIAYWYMDDGYLYKTKQGINCYELGLCVDTTLNQAQLIIEFFKEKYDIEFRLKHRKSNSENHQYRLKITNIKNTNKFMRLVRSEVSKIPSMHYKLI